MLHKKHATEMLRSLIKHRENVKNNFGNAIKIEQIKYNN